MHMSVLVIGGFVDEQLEYFAMDPDPSCVDMEWNDTQEEEAAFYNNPDSLVRGYVDAGGKFHPSWTEEGMKLKNADAPETDVHISVMYSTLDKYLDSTGYERDPETRRIGYWSNPNGRWDWYEIGGRWSNVLINKKGGYTAQDLKGDIDWEATFEDRKRSAAQEWHSLLSQRRQLLIENGTTKEQYIDCYSCLPIGAILYDGEWLDEDEGYHLDIVTEPDSYKKWGDFVWNKIQEIDDEELLTLVDCHI